MRERFSLDNRVVVITGGGGLLGRQHAEAIAEVGGIPVLFDIDGERTWKQAEEIAQSFGIECKPFIGDVSNEVDVKNAAEEVIKRYGHVDGLINNAALNPKLGNTDLGEFTRLEHFELESWNKQLSVGLTGAFLCSKIFGTCMADCEGGIIVNISSDLGLIAPDQRLYQQDGVEDADQPVKPVTYSVIKHGLIGLTRYLATYWGDRGIRSNALCPGGVQVDESPQFVSRLSSLIPLGRMASPDEYKSAIQFLCSDASSYMNGACLVIDGGRSCW